MKHECDCKKHQMVLFGEKPDQSDGLVWVSTKTADAVFGTKDDPDSGLIRKVREHEQWKLKIMGGAFVIGGLAGFAGNALIKYLTSN